jgi:hypothetical protein
MSREPSTEINRMDARFDVIEGNIKQWISNLPNNTDVYDLDLGGGQLAKIVESCYNTRITGYAKNNFFKNIAVNGEKLTNGKYFTSGIDAQTLEEFKNDMEKFVRNIKANWSKIYCIGNPAYTIGLGRVNIYHVSLETLALLDVAGLLYIIPYKWMAQPDRPLGKSVRKSLKVLGIKTIIINPLDLFKDTGVLTETCTVICEKGYKGDINIRNNDGTESFLVTQAEFDDRIFPFFDQSKRNLIMKHKQTQENRIFFDSSTDSNGVKSKYDQQWVLMTSYQKNNYDKDPINPVKAFNIPSDRTTKDMIANGQVFSNEQEAREMSGRWNSYLFSKPIQWHFKNTRMSTTLDDPQLDYVPNFINNQPTKIYTDQDIYRMGNYTAEEIEIIENDR